jgi:hypothetical protein
MLQESHDPGSAHHALWQAVPGQVWGSAVVVRRGVVRPIAVAGYEGWVTGGEWVTHDDGQPIRQTFVFSVHSPTTDAFAERASYVSESRSIVRAIVAAVPSACELVIGGDFNFKSLGERLPSEELQTTPQEREALTEFRAASLVPAWHAAHPDRPLPQTLRWTGNRVTPYHCDGFLLRPSAAERALCEVLSTPAI